MTQLQGISTTGFSYVSSFTAFQAEYNEYVSFLCGGFYPTPGSSAVFGSTVRILQFSFWLKVFEPVYFEYSDSAEDNNCSVIVKENVIVQGGASIKLEVEKHPVDLLFEIFQTANSWLEISEFLKTYEEYKQQAWDLLTPLEQRRVVSITPLEVQKLSHAKRAGLIVDFCELREGVYQVQRQGSSFLEIVNQQRVDYFLARL